MPILLNQVLWSHCDLCDVQLRKEYGVDARCETAVMISLLLEHMHLWADKPKTPKFVCLVWRDLMVQEGRVGSPASQVACRIAVVGCLFVHVADMQVLV